MKVVSSQWSVVRRSGASFDTLVKDNDEEANYGDDAKNDQGYSQRVHLDTSIPSRR